MININSLPPFKKMCVTIGNLPTSFMESMSYYEALCWMYNYLDKTVIPAINTEGEAITELQTAFTTLKSYVDSYFENLDVQEEINNKLDDMAESGELTDIIAQYLGLAGVLAFNTVADMKAAENLVNGSITKTLGYSVLNDKGGAFYKIRTITNDDVIDEKTKISLHDNSLIAVLINNGINNIKIFNDDIITAIANSSILILNNNTYNITVSNTIIKSNIHIIGNNSTINTNSNVGYIFNFNNAIIDDVKFIETNINDYSKNIIFTGKNITFNNCYLESTVGYSGEIENIIFNKCEFKNYYREIHQGSGTLNNLKVLNCKFSKIQNYSTPYQGNNRILIYNFNGTTNSLDETMLSLHGNNIEIKGCIFASCNIRQIQIFNCYNVIIEDNIFNATGNDSSTVGGSDDLVGIDFVNYFKINNNYFGSSGENDLDLLSSHYGEIKNNNFEKPYDYFSIDINISDYVKTFGENLIDRTLLKSSNIIIENNTIKDTNTYSINITPSDNIHIHNNNITNSTGQSILLLNDFGANTPENPSNLKISNLDVGKNNVTSTLGNFGRISIRTNHNYVIDNNSGHLSEDICCYETQTVNASSMVYCTPNFPCKNGKAGKLIALDGSFRSVTPSIVRWVSTQSVRRGIDFVGNRYNSPYWGTMFYTGDYLDNYPLGQAGDANGSYDGTETSGTIAFKSY